VSRKTERTPDGVKGYSVLIPWRRFIKVANETMCRPIRALTEARGFATGKHM
jgi:hypothetical protein